MMDAGLTLMFCGRGARVTGDSLECERGRSASEPGCNSLAALRRVRKLNYRSPDVWPSRINQPEGLAGSASGSAQRRPPHNLQPKRKSQMTQPAPIRILSVDDHPLLREGIAMIIKK